MTNLAGKDGGDWGGTLSGPEVLQALQEGRMRLGLRNNVAMLEYTRTAAQGGGTGVYDLLHAPAVDTFP